MKKENIVSYSANDIVKMIAAGESRTDVSRIPSDNAPETTEENSWDWDKTQAVAVQQAEEFIRLRKQLKLSKSKVSQLLGKNVKTIQAWEKRQSLVDEAAMDILREVISPGWIVQKFERLSQR